MRRALAAWSCLGLLLGVWLSPLQAVAAERCPVADEQPSPLAAAAALAEAQEARQRTSGQAAAPASAFAAASMAASAFVLAHPGHEGALDAALWAMEALVSAGSPAGHCDEHGAQLASHFLAQLCKPAETASDERCDRLGSLRTRMDQRRASRLFESAALLPEGASRRKAFREASGAYAALWTDDLQAACRQRKTKCEYGPEVLSNAAHAADRAGDRSRAITLRAILLDPRNQLHESPLAMAALVHQATAFQSMAEWSTAAEHYERLANVAPKHDDAPRSLADAVALRMMLGQLDMAKRNLETWQRLFGAKRPGEFAPLVVGLARAMKERGVEPAELVRFVGDKRAAVAADDPVATLAVDLLLAEALLAQSKHAEATKAYERIRLAAPLLDDPGRLKRGPTWQIAAALTAVGEARVFFADMEAQRARAVKLNKADLTTLERRKKAVDAAELAYLKVLELTPFPPPGPTVRAAARVASMRSQWWADSVLVFGVDQSEPLLRTALSAHQRCADVAAKFQVIDKEAQACVQFVGRFAPQRLRPMPEWIPRFRAAESIGPAPEPVDPDRE